MAHGFLRHLPALYIHTTTGSNNRPIVDGSLLNTTWCTDRLFNGARLTIFSMVKQVYDASRKVLTTGQTQMAFILEVIPGLVLRDIG